MNTLQTATVTRDYVAKAANEATHACGTLVGIVGTLDERWVLLKHDTKLPPGNYLDDPTPGSETFVSHDYIHRDLSDVALAHGTRVMVVDQDRGDPRWNVCGRWVPGTTKRFPTEYLALEGDTSVADVEREVDDITDSVGAHIIDSA